MPYIKLSEPLIPFYISYVLSCKGTFFPVNLHGARTLFLIIDIRATDVLLIDRVVSE